MIHYFHKLLAATFPNLIFFCLKKKTHGVDYHLSKTKNLMQSQVSENA